MMRPNVATTTISPKAPGRLRLPDSVSVLAERDFRIVWIGQAVSMTGTWMQAVAQGLLVLSLWDSAFALGSVNFANAVPSLVVMLFGGVLADRADKRRILLITQIVMCTLALALALLIVGDRAQFWMIIVATALLGVAFGYDMPAYQSFLPDLVPPEKISQVVALNSSTFHGTRMVGPAIAGGVIGAMGIAAAYFINAASFLAVILSLLIVRSRPPATDVTQAGSALDGLKAGLRHARGRPNLQILLLLTALNCTFLFPSMAILSPYYVKNVLGEGAGVLGILWAMSGVGSLIGALALVWWPTQHRSLRIWAAALVGPLALMAMAMTRDPVVAVLMAGCTSISFSSQLGLIQAMIQESTPREYRGRVMSLHGITFNGTMPFAGLASAGLAAAIGLPFVMALSAGVYVVAAAVILRFAAGGIERVVAASAMEHDVVLAAG
jgi:MFS family permease